MRNRIQIVLAVCFILMSSAAKSQIIISLLFGEALNTPRVEFGLVGGINRAYMLDIKDSEPLNAWNIGFYFHYQLKGKSFLSTGVLVKSNVGARGMSTYAIGDEDFDEVYENGELTKEVHYFYLPVMYQYRFLPMWYIEGGIQAGLRNQAYDIFTEDAYSGTLTYTKDVRDEYKHLDAGFIGGIGFKFEKEMKSTAVGVNYYYGLVNVSTTETQIRNSSVYFYAKIPIGLGGGKDKDIPDE